MDRPLQKIREFRNRPNPRVAVTVDMLSTGVDIPALEFIVFLRPVKSRILWVQMLGRGTRRCPDINKGHFTIFDCFDGTLIEYFKDTTDFKVEPPQKEPISVEQVIENIYQNIDRVYYSKVLVKRLRRIDRNMSGEARKQFAAFISDGDMGRFAGELLQRIKNDFTPTLNLLRDKKFQELLVNYPRARRTFTVGYEQEDEVTSEVMIRRGREYQKPRDYLDAFTEFVKEKADQIEAIGILLERPSAWRTEVLNELQKRLMKNDFPEEELQKAHKLVYNKALVDIISMIKHGARAESPLYTAAERVDRALKKVMADKTFDEEQTEWLGYIREHLVENLTLEMDDFDDMPVFERQGGSRRAKKVFGDDLTPLIRDINYSIAA